MKQNSFSPLYTFLYSLPTIFPNGKDFLVNDIASLCQEKIKTNKRNLLGVFLLVLAVSFGQNAVAKNTSNTNITYQKFIVDYILISSVAEGRGGGGGHGHCDLLNEHPLGANQVDLRSGISNKNNLNFYKYEK
jgi:hypothetical protein